MENTVCVSGASGFVGKEVCLALANAGFEVRALVRHKKHLGKKTRKNIKQIVADFFDHQSLMRASKGASVFFHFVGTSRKTRDTSYEKINIGSTETALAACKKNNVKKFVYISGLGVGPKNRQVYFRSKWLAETKIKKSGVNYTIFRPSYIIGKQSDFVQRIARQAKKDGVVVPGSGNYRLQPINVNDFAKICVKIACGKKTRRKVFDLVGPKVVSFKEFSRLVCWAIKTKPVFRFLPLEKAIQKALREPNPVYSSGELVVLVSDTFSSHKPLEKEFSIKLTSLEKTIEEIFKPK